MVTHSEPWTHEHGVTHSITPLSLAVFNGSANKRQMARNGGLNRIESRNRVVFITFLWNYLNTWEIVKEPTNNGGLVIVRFGRSSVDLGVHVFLHSEPPRLLLLSPGCVPRLMLLMLMMMTWPKYLTRKTYTDFKVVRSSHLQSRCLLFGLFL